MTRRISGKTVRIAAALALVALAGCAAQESKEPCATKGEALIVAFDKGFDFSKVETREAKASPALAPDGSVNGLRLEASAGEDWPGITVKPPEGGVWDFSKFSRVRFEATNLSDKAENLRWRIDNPGGDGKKNCVSLGAQVLPGKTREIELDLGALDFQLSEPVKFIGMKGYPDQGREGFDAKNVTQMLFFVAHPDGPRSFVIGNVKGDLAPARKTIETAKFLPFIDRYGQFIHSDWPGKIHSDEEFKAEAAKEASDLAANPGVSDRDSYGGWAKGPQLEASGSFRTQKLDGKWWLVDPAGRLFWSHGVDGVRSSSGTTPTTDRESYFESLPSDGPFKQFCGKHSWAPVGYYKDKPKPFETFNFSASNLYRKYGEGWRDEFARSSHARLKSWNMNTIGNWSDEGICLMRKTPYVKAIGSSGPFIKGSEGYWGQFPDPFAPEFRAGLAKAFAAETGKSAGDPMCIGYFVDNELSWGWWGDRTKLALGALASPEEQPAKQELLKDLKAKYVQIESLNKAWGSSYASWDALAKSQAAPDAKKAAPDMTEFMGRIAEQYFKVCREEQKRVAPNNLYLGCRFANYTESVIVAQAAKYCDVVSYNLYYKDISGMSLPDGLDKPVIIGEFHFGALDRGMFHPGLVPVADQNARGAAYKSYVEGALSNPYIVGTHWFLFGSQPVTGRGDGENCQIGLVDICDTPYAETVSAIRETGGKLYELRRDGGSK